MIRQAISCDICASEKKQTNHWFVAYEASGELRVSGWNSRNRLRPGSKHLCGQTCLHKLVDDFMARAIAVRAPASAVAEEPEVVQKVVASDTSLTADTAYGEIESSARLLTPPSAPTPAILPNRALSRPPAELVAMPARVQAEDSAPLPDEPPRFASRNWRAEAWDRERERETRGAGRRPEAPTRRRAGS